MEQKRLQNAMFSSVR